MKLSAARDCYYSHSGNASSAARQIAFAGIAVVWVFNQPQSGAPIGLPEQLIAVLLFLCIALALDLLQYSVSTAIWGFYSRVKEKELKHKFHSDPDIEPPPQLNWPGVTFFWFKLSALFAAYLLLARYLATSLAWQ
jgi:hypothetical protein